MTGVETLEDLADLLEREKAQGREDHVFCTWERVKIYLAE